MRVRTLTFDDSTESRERFSLIYQGFVTGGNQPNAKTMEIMRREAAVLSKLESISEDTDERQCDSCGQLVRSKREVMPGSHELQLSVPEWELLKQYFERTPWTVRMSSKVIDISDWLASLPAAQSA